MSVDPIIVAFVIGILLAGWLMGRVLTADEQRDPRWTYVLLGAVVITGLVAGGVLTLLQ